MFKFKKWFKFHKKQNKLKKPIPSQFVIKGKYELGFQLKRFYGFIKRQIIKLIHLRADVNQIAFGFAFGVFVGVFPTFGLGFILIFGLAFFVKFNVPAAFIGSFAGNPIFSPIWIPLSYQLGRFLAKSGVNFSNFMFLEDKSVRKVLKKGLEYLAGNLIISIVVSVISYFLIKEIIIYYRKRKIIKLEKKKGKKLNQVIKKKERLKNPLD